MRVKLRPRYIGPYEIIAKLNLVAYPLDLHIDPEHVCKVFHISQLRKYVLDPNHAIIMEPIEISEDLANGDCPVHILNRRIQQLHHK